MKNATNRCLELGSVLKKEYPELELFYRSNYTLHEAMEHLGLRENYAKYKLSAKSIERSIRHALWGYAGDDINPGFEGLIPEAERETVQAKHKSDVLIRKGIGSRSTEVKTKLGRKGYSAGLGKLPVEKYRINGAKGGKVLMDRAGTSVHSPHNLEVLVRPSSTSFEPELDEI